MISFEPASPKSLDMTREKGLIGEPVDIYDEEHLCDMLSGHHFQEDRIR